MRKLHESAFIMFFHHFEESWLGNVSICFNALTADGKYPFHYCQNLQLPIQMQLSEKRKTFSQFFVWFLESTSNFKHFRKKMMVIANMFPKLQTVKNFITPLCKKCRFSTRLDNRHVKVSRILAESTLKRFYQVFSSFWGKLIWKMALVVLRNLWWVFFNTLTADDKYPFQYCENLDLVIQMIFSENRKAFSQTFVQFLESTSNFKHFEKKDHGHS